MKRILIIIAAIVIVGGVAYYAYSRYAAQKRSEELAAEFTETGFKLGSGADEKVVEKINEPLKIDYGVSIYPGSKASETPSAYVENAGVQYTIGTFSTSDSADKVVAYYQKQFGSDAQTNKATLGDVVYTVITKKNINRPVASVYRDGKLTSYMLITY
ncbi:MAG: hypothetical protein OEV37_01720 [Candidatus Berkelbacteria bacterium]|nr:hypothetical protein [Candidatus Berkelbacteria bacterium]